MSATRPATGHTDRPAVLRRRAAAAVLAVIAAAVTTVTPSAFAASDTWCGPSLGGTWDAAIGRCSVSMTSRAEAIMNFSLTAPPGMLDNPFAGPILRAYLVDIGTGWRKTGGTVPHDNVSFVEPEEFSHSNTIKTVVFHEQFHTYTTNANNAYRTFTFDLQRGKVLTLADLFKPGVDPLTAIPGPAQPYVEDALAQAPPPHQPDTYPFVVDRWQPRPDGSGFSGNYRAFALTPNELILYMPDDPMTHENPIPPGDFVWSMDGGVVQAHIPLSALASVLAPAYAA